MYKSDDRYIDELLTIMVKSKQREDIRPRNNKTIPRP